MALHPEVMRKDARIYIAGHTGLAGSAICRQLRAEGFHNLITRSHDRLDLTRQVEVEAFIQQKKPEYIFLAAAKDAGRSGNILQPADMCYSNLMISANVIEAAYRSGVKKLLYLGATSPCAAPLRQDGDDARHPPEPCEMGDEGYACAKTVGLTLCKFYRRQYRCDYIAAIPAELYGLHDAFLKQGWRILPALIHTLYEAKARGEKQVTLAGSGKERCDLLFADDLARAAVHLMNHYSAERPVSVSTGEAVTLSQLAIAVSDALGYTGDIRFDGAQPADALPPPPDVSELALQGCECTTGPVEGVRMLCQWYLKQKS